jgi:uncharacterized protein GlcG (DUF336 family)
MEVGLMKLDLATAEAVIAAAKAAAEQKRLPPVSISVVDEAAHLVAFSRMDGTFLGAIDVAHRKARTAALFNAGNFCGRGGQPTLLRTATAD